MLSKRNPYDHEFQTFLDGVKAHGGKLPSNKEWAETHHNRSLMRKVADFFRKVFS